MIYRQADFIIHERYSASESSNKICSLVFNNNILQYGKKSPTSLNNEIFLRKPQVTGAKLHQWQI
jgi:hypothetical protein